MSQPIRAAWIEIEVWTDNPYDYACRSPFGLRGLKYNVIGEVTEVYYSRSPLGLLGLKS